MKSTLSANALALLRLLSDGHEHLVTQTYSPGFRMSRRSGAYSRGPVVALDELFALDLVTRETFSCSDTHQGFTRRFSETYATITDLGRRRLAEHESRKEVRHRRR